MRASRLVGLVVVALLVGAFTYVFLCHPDVELLRSDPAAYKRVYGSTNPLGWRCGVLCVASSLIVLFIGIGSGIAARALGHWRSGTRSTEFK
ncbi:MAG: hypothetical protein ACR2L3_06385 [Actinomycetota bacterium]